MLDKSARGDLCWTCCESLIAALVEVAMRLWNLRSRQARRMSSGITIFGFRKADFVFFYGPGWQDPVGDSHGEQKALGKLIDLQGKPPQSRRCFLLTEKKQTTHLQKTRAGFGELQASQPCLAPPGKLWSKCSQEP